MTSETRCDTTLTVKAAGTEPFRCTLPAFHASGVHLLEQAGTGKKRMTYDSPCCSPGRWMMYYQAI